jgi:hypothetical protein
VSIRKLKEVHDRTHPGAQLRPRAQKVAQDVEPDADDLLSSLAAEAEEEALELASS